MDTQAFYDALQQCMEGTADPALQKTVIEAASHNPRWQAVLLDEAAFDALLRTRVIKRNALVSNVMDSITRRRSTETFTRNVSEKIRRRSQNARTLRWALPLAAAAGLLLVFGIGLWRTASPTPASFATVVTFEGEPEAFVERKGARLAIKPGDPLFLADSIQAHGRGRIVLASEQRGLRLILGRQGRLTLMHPRQIHLSQGRLDAEFTNPAPASESFAILTGAAEARIVGTRLIMFADPTNTRLRVMKGQVHFKAANRDEAIDVAAGECAMIHLDRETIYKADYTPEMSVEGRIVLSDSFESDLSQWQPVLISEKGNVSHYPDHLPAFASWTHVERDGVTTGCMEFKVTDTLPKGHPAMVPRNFTLPDYGFVAHLDVFYKSHSKFSSMSFFFRGITRLYERPEYGMLLTRMLQEKRWGQMKVVYQPFNDPQARFSHESEYYIDDTLVENTITGQILTPLLTMKCRKGNVLVDNVTVRELLTFD